MEQNDQFPDSARQSLLDAFRVRYMLESDEGVPTASVDLSSQLADQLRLKSADYGARLDRLAAKSTPDSLKGYADALYKKTVLDELLRSGSVDLFGAVDVIAQQLDPRSDLRLRSGLAMYGSQLAEEQGITAAAGGEIRIPKEVDDAAQKQLALSAFSIIRDYSLGKSAHLEGGSGLPQTPDSNT